MNTIAIRDNMIHYRSGLNLPHKDKSWNLPIENIRVIGVVNRMDGDDDSDFLVFADGQANRFIVKYSQPIEGWDTFESALLNLFSINLPSALYDSDVVLHPKNISGRRLYRFSPGSSLKNIFAITHVADGAFSEEVIDAVSS